MKLIVIVLCLLSERFLIHRLSYNRFYWFGAYVNVIYQKIVSKKEFLSNPVILLILWLLPILVPCYFIYLLTDHFFFGLFLFIFNLGVFYYCLGPENSFYPIRTKDDTQEDEAFVSVYFAAVNNQLFAVIFWYLLTGVFGVLTYRLINLCKEQEPTLKLANNISDLLDYIPARITMLFYLFVGNFQQAISFAIQNFFSRPANNKVLLSNVGLLAARKSEADLVSQPKAEEVVTQALIAYLVVIACFSLVIWF